MKELTLEIVDKIRNNCKDKGTYVGYVNEDKDTEVEFWELNIYDEEAKEFAIYNLVKSKIDNEYDKYTEWSISREYGDIEYDFDYALNNDNDDYNLEDWINEYNECLETNRDIIKLVEEYEGYSLIINV